MARKLGQIIPRGKDRWLVRVSLGRDQATGRRRYLNRTIAGSLRKAQQFLATQLVERAESKELAGAEMTLNQYLDRWLSLAARPRLRAKSCADYSALLARYIRPVLGDRSLSELEPLSIQVTYQGMLERKLSARTVQYSHGVLHSALEQAVQWRQLARNPAKGLALPKVRQAHRCVLNVDQARGFLTAALKTRYGVAFAVLLTTGLRPSELLALRWSDIDWFDQAITISRTLEKGRGWRFGETKRPASRRRIKLQSWVMRLLSDFRQERVITDSGSSQIFHTQSGRPISSDYLGRVLKVILQDAKLPQIRLYDLRHSAASLALAAGVPAKVISEQLGHSNTAFTLDTYAHLLPHAQSEAVQRVEALLGIKKPPVSIRQPVASVTALAG